MSHHTAVPSLQTVPDTESPTVNPTVPWQGCCPILHQQTLWVFLFLSRISHKSPVAGSTSAMFPLNPASVSVTVWGWNVSPCSRGVIYLAVAEHFRTKCWVRSQWDSFPVVASTDSSRADRGKHHCWILSYLFFLNRGLRSARVVYQKDLALC